MILTIFKIIGLILLGLIVLFILFVFTVAFVSDAGFKARDEEAMKLIEQQKKSLNEKT